MDYYQHSQRPSALYTIDRRLKSSTGVPIPPQVQRIYFKLPRLCDVFYVLKTHKGDSKAPLLPQLLEDCISNMAHDNMRHEWSSYGHAKVDFRHLLCLSVALGA